jgi:hypothetical protein
MDADTLHERTLRPRTLGRNLRDALADLFSQEFSFSTGHLTALLGGCLFAPSLLTFWFINGLLDFSTAVALGTVASAAGLQIRLLAYLLLVPTFLLLRIGVHLAHPGHRKQVLAGSCPRTDVLSLDWFSVGILATGLPLSLQSLGPWVVMNAVLLVGVLLVPQVTSGRVAVGSKVVAIVVAPALFFYARYGAMVSVLPEPAAFLGPVATTTLSDGTTAQLMELANSLLVGPLLVAGFALLMNYLLTHPEVRDIPVVQHSLPNRDPVRVVGLSAALGTVFYLLVVAGASGGLVVVP